MFMLQMWTTVSPTPVRMEAPALIKKIHLCVCVCQVTVETDVSKVRRNLRTYTPSLTLLSNSRLPSFHPGKSVLISDVRLMATQSLMMMYYT